MTQPNPFERPTAPAEQPVNPYAHPTQAYPPAPAPAAEPYAGAPQAGPVATPAWLTQPTAAEQASYAPAAPAPAAVAPSGPPPALDINRLQAAAPPPPSGDGKGAKFADMYGRLVLFFPLALTRRPRNPQFISVEQRNRGDVEQDQLTATVVVLDDGRGGMQPIAYGGDLTKVPATPHTESAPLPYVRKGMWITQSKVIDQLRTHLPSAPGAAPGMVCGRLVKTGPQHNDAWYVQGATDQELQLAGAYLQLVASGQYPHPLA